MLAIDAKPLPDETKVLMDKHSDNITEVQEFSNQVVQAIKLWEAKTPKRLFDELKRILESMCNDVKLCMYCERSEAKEIEHRRPKSLYPRQTFDWDNMLYVCGPCNRNKTNKFAILNRPYSNGYIKITPKPKEVPVKPKSGIDAFINQRAENPLDFIWLDLITFRFTPINPNQDSLFYWKAKFTIETLFLNEQSMVRGRESAYDAYHNTLYYYLRNIKPTRDIEFRRFLKTTPHKTVWEEMKRQHKQIDNLHKLFQQAPEALTW